MNELLVTSRNQAPYLVFLGDKYTYSTNNEVKSKSSIVDIPFIAFLGKTTNETCLVSEANQAIRNSQPTQSSDIDIEFIPNDAQNLENCSPEVKDFLALVQESYDNDRVPELSEEGVGGTYFLKSKSDGKKFAVFKPGDEEPYAPNNPKRLLLRNSYGQIKPQRNGFREGEGYLRETAAYLLDHDGFAGVPPTIIVKYYWPEQDYSRSNYLSRRQSAQKNSEKLRNVKSATIKIGSLQKYVDHFCSTEDMGFSQFKISDVHRIGVLDIRLLNCDRHLGNILVKKDAQTQEFSLFPIDHGYSLGSSLGEALFEWITWPQADKPFDEETKQYVANLDIEQDVKIIKSLGLGEKSIATLKITTTLLKKCVAANLTLSKIGKIICRDIS